VNEAIAISRAKLSRPVQAAIADGVLTRSRTYFDYGEGRGDDVKLLRRRRYKAHGWDPHHSPDKRKRRADVVGLVFVLNIIPSARRRNAALRGAAGLARRSLLVAVREDQATGRPFRDGVVTSAKTFQRNYRPGDVPRLIRRVLGRPARRLAPGVFVVDMR
jgi:DNA phosphorothioation-associated putative methyltransferase